MDLAAKLQPRPGQSVSIVNPPPGDVLALGGDHPVADEPGQADALIVFCAGRADLDRLERSRLVPPARRDALTWVAYPKAGKLGTDLNRDVLAELVGVQEVRPVR